jgi:lipopolysaccharide transport system ATP-binding protein
MSDIAIRVEGLGKQYRIGKRERYRTLRDTVTETLTAPFRHARQRFSQSSRSEDLPPDDRIWALQDVSFEVPVGSVVGIIGCNGAGKSTLLKILSRITEPTRGRVEIHGRVGSLLEVGTGFHPELTGRENIFLNGAILGMKKTEIARKFDEIVAFAEVDRFIDTPVKHFSSGMYMRLAFAVAAHLEPEILVIDEVLAVGDAQFQKKCLGKMGDVARHGRTVLFVSHNMVAIGSLCARAIRLEAGRVVDQGPAAKVVSRYLHDDSRTVGQVTWSDPQTAPGDEVVRLQQVRLLNGRAVVGEVALHDPASVEVSYSNNAAGALLNISLFLYGTDDVCIFNSVSPPTKRPKGIIRETCEIPASFFNTGMYRIGVMVVRDASAILVHQPDVLSFEAFEAERSVSWYGDWPGVVRPNLTWRSRCEAETIEAEMLCQSEVLL